MPAFASALAWIAGCVASPRIVASGPHPTAAQTDCGRVLRNQAAAWNRGDLLAFADGYWNSAHLVFAGARGATVGFDQMLSRYQKRYPSKAKMGVLSFDQLAYRPLDDETMIVEGGWTLRRTTGQPGGRLLLIMRRIGGQWKIVIDYTVSTTANPVSLAVPTAETLGRAAQRSPAR